MSFDDRHRRVIEQLLIRSPLSWKELQKRAQLQRSEDEFGLVLLRLIKQKTIEAWSSADTRMIRIKPAVRAQAEKEAKSTIMRGSKRDLDDACELRRKDWPS